MDIGLTEDFMNLTLKSREIKANKNEWDFFKLKSFRTGKETYQQNKKGPNLMGEDIYKQQF